MAFAAFEDRDFPRRARGRRLGRREVEGRGTTIKRAFEWIEANPTSNLSELGGPARQRLGGKFRNI